MATTMASPVTLAVPAMSARMPYSGASSSLGSQYGDVKNSAKSMGPTTKANPSMVMKTKMPMIKTMAEIPPMKTRS